MSERVIEVKAEDLKMTLEHMKKEGFTYLSFITAADYVDSLKLFYRLVNISTGDAVLIQTTLSAEESQVDSAAHLFKGAEWQEREVFDLFGVKFKGHPDLKRILLPQDFEGHPLRKNWSSDEVENRPGDFV